MGQNIMCIVKGASGSDKKFWQFLQPQVCKQGPLGCSRLVNEGDRAFVIRLWNSPPVDLRLVSSLMIFNLL